MHRLQEEVEAIKRKNEEVQLIMEQQEIER